jgi:UDP-N-acetylmuramoylalanine--D-glutamate ligase
MAQDLYRNFKGLHIGIAGAGVTGIACATALQKRGAEITLIDDNVTESSDFAVVSPESIDISRFDRLLISPGWKEEHPIIQKARSAEEKTCAEMDSAYRHKWKDHHCRTRCIHAQKRRPDCASMWKRWDNCY